MSEEYKKYSGKCDDCFWDTQEGKDYFRDNADKWEDEYPCTGCRNDNFKPIRKQEKFEL